MAKEKDIVTMEATAAVKTVRAAIRLKYSLLADAEINEAIPAVERQVYEAAASGKPFQVDLSSVFSS